MRVVIKISAIFIIAGLFNEEVKAQKKISSERLNMISLAGGLVRGTGSYSDVAILGYRYQLLEKIRAGADLGHAKREYIIAGSTDFVYSQYRSVEWYWTVSAGYRKGNGSYSSNKELNGDGEYLRHFVYQVNPIAMRIGNGQVSGFGELGWGYKGLLNLGAAFKF
ncbi:hypothetical protein [Pedobacter cryoconitis]|uniref:Outer membrane protein beta-barrel domain-containing protein n=1 Tax=Pedobacter cryoconitis TaxID=188932 RepID=A0A7X0J1B3_9SPHI|nr:hypothetical protein [Pedobacter cryoconitis]MBB6499274.1 hypothetical protein [Pedobacter cryoconitis]